MLRVQLEDRNNELGGIVFDTPAAVVLSPACGTSRAVTSAVCTASDVVA